jgi:endonuclease-8
VLTRTDFRVPQHATVDLAGATVAQTVSRGKHLLTRIDGDVQWTLHTHLKMEGAWRVLAPGQRWSRPAHQARVVLETARKVAVGFSLGIVELLPRDQEHEVVGHLGPDLLGPDWDEVEAVRRLLEEPARPLHEALLDQRNLAGIGNMYMAELCFTSGVHPATAVGDVPDLMRLVRRSRLMLEQNARRATQSTTGNLREPWWVYRRDKAACRRCGTRIVVETLGPPGRERATYWCPSCQPAR